MKEFRRRISSTNPPPANSIGQKNDWPNHNNNNDQQKWKGKQEIRVTLGFEIAWKR